MKTAAECTNLADVRAAIDEIDSKVIDLIALRRGYVIAATTFKTSAADVRAPERVSAMITQRRGWAIAAGLNPDPIEQVFRTLVSYFTDAELLHWKRQTAGE